MKIKTKEGEGEVVAASESIVIAKINGKEKSFNKNEVMVWMPQPCEGCTRGCYNYAIGDCRDDYKWEQIWK